MPASAGSACRSQPDRHLSAVIVGLVQFMLPFAVLLLAPAVVAIPEEVELASKSLAGAHWPTIWHVILPMAKPGLIARRVVVFTLTMTDFAMPEIIGGGTTDFIANAIYDGFFQISDRARLGARDPADRARQHPGGADLRAIGVGTLGYVQAQRCGGRAMMRQPERARSGRIVLFDLVFLALPTSRDLVTSFTAGNVIRFPPEGLSLRWYETLLASALQEALLRTL